MKNGVVELVDKASRLMGQRVTGACLDELDSLLEKIDDNQSAVALFSEVCRAAGLEGTSLRLHNPTPVHLPFAAYGMNCGWCLITARNANGRWRCEGSDGMELPFESLDGLECMSLPRRSNSKQVTPDAMRLVRNALWSHKGVFIDAVLATSLITLLALAISLFSMQVYDRVIPNKGFSTLWVLTVGVALSICLEFILKHVRSRSVDRACNAIDHELSEWFFKRMLGIRMESRPPSVGTLASQVKGFEMVRGVLASTSLFVITDVPFALIFVLIIGLIGGWLVAVPLIALPIALAAGLMFQSAIQRHAEQNLSASNRKTGLLVEAVDGVESLKANSAEWSIQARWNQLVAETGAAEQNIRNYSALSQNLTASFQQLTYIALVAVGAYFVAENHMTMGALMACSIISNRALMPIVQLPGVMVQWAQAQAAIKGLEQIIALPNEEDEANDALAPQGLEGGFRIERTRFSYGIANRMALEIERMEIKPGERIGLIGAIGSGKSTLLKLASGMYRPVEGKMVLGGVDMALLAPQVIREIVGYLPQDARLYSGSLRENLLMGLPDPGEEAILNAARRTGLIELILSQPRGLALEITEGGRGVSGGQKQLISLTRMLLARPNVWLLDEPTGAMDSVTEARVVSLLHELAAEGITMMITTHKTALLPLLDRLIVLQGGRVLLDGQREVVLSKLSGKPQPLVRELVG
jgi:ATP-binding cassette subfamily C protein LapB